MYYTRGREYSLAKQMNIEEFEAFFQRYKDRVFRTAYSILGDSGEAEDMVQEVFVKVYRSGGFLHPEKGKFEAWLHRLTVNQCISSRRKKHSPLSVERLEEDGFELPEDKSLSPEELLIKKEESKKVWRALRSLDKRHRTVLALRYFDDLCYDEIAQVLKIPLGTVKSRLSSAIEALRKEQLGKD